MPDITMPEAESELADMANMFGWLPFRGAPQTVDGLPEADMVMVDGNDVIIVKVAVLPPGTSKKSVGDKSEELNKIYHKTVPAGIGEQRNIEVGFAVRVGLMSEWYWADRDNNILYSNGDYTPMSEVF